MHKMLWVMTLAGAVGCGGTDGPQGPEGPQGPQGPPGGTMAGINALQPSRSFLGRNVSVQIGGNNTNFAQGITTVDFGDRNVKVNKVTVASPTLLQADITIGPATAASVANPTSWAKLAAHDITVTTMTGQVNEVITAKGLFTVDSPLVLEVFKPDGTPGGDLVQGGLASVNLINLDATENPFVVQSSLFSLDVKLDAALSGSGVFQFNDGSEHMASGLALIDIKASTTPDVVAVGPDALGNNVTYVLPQSSANAPKVKARTPEELTVSMVKMGSIGAAQGTSIYHIAAQPAGDNVLTANFDLPTGSTYSPALFVLPDSGRWSDSLQRAGGASFADTGGPVPFLSVVPGAKDLYLIVYDGNLGGGTGFNYNLTVKTKPAYEPATYTAGTAPATPNTQVDLTKGPNFIKTAMLKSQTDKNYFEFPSGTIKTKIQIITGPPDPTKDNTDVTLTLLNGTCKAGTPIGSTIDNDYYESTSLVAAAGKTYCLVVGISDQSTVGGNYTLLVTPNL